MNLAGRPQRAAVFGHGGGSLLRIAQIRETRRLEPDHSGDACSEQKQRGDRRPREPGSGDRLGFQSRPHCLRGGVAVLRPAGEQPLDDRTEPAWHLGTDRADVGDLPQVAEHRAQGGAPFVRAPSGQHLEQDDTQAVEIASCVHLVAQDLLGREVLKRADNCIMEGGARLVRRQRQGEPKVAELHISFGRQEDVPGLDVAVDDRTLVEDGEAFEDLRSDPDRLADRERAFAEAAVERPSFDHLHGEEYRVVRGGDVEDPHQPIARHVAGDFDLPAQAEQRGGREAVRAQGLERHVALELAVAGAIDDGQAATAEDFPDFIAAGQDFAGSDLGRSWVRLARFDGLGGLWLPRHGWKTVSRFRPSPGGEAPRPLTPANPPRISRKISCMAFGEAMLPSQCRT